MPDPMNSIENVRLRLAEAVRTAGERTPRQQSELLASLLAVAFAATRPSLQPV